MGVESTLKANRVWSRVIWKEITPNHKETKEVLLLLEKIIPKIISVLAGEEIKQDTKI
jgi:oligoribonuclease (3'-5' exoribonuclease)